MKANELRIGNLITTLGSSTVEQIDSISNNMVSAWDFPKMKGNWNYDAEDIRPVKLTEEWLVKLGFTIPEGFPNQRQINGFSIMSKHSRYRYLLLGYANSVELKYVHQLQNLYHSITGKELSLA